MMSSFLCKIWQSRWMSRLPLAFVLAHFATPYPFNPSPTVVPGSSHVVKSNSFPYEFWQPTPAPFSIRRIFLGNDSDFSNFYGKPTLSSDTRDWKMLPVQLPDDLVSSVSDSELEEESDTEITYPMYLSPQYGRNPGATEPPPLYNYEDYLKNQGLYNPWKQKKEIQNKQSGYPHSSATKSPPTFSNDKFHEKYNEISPAEEKYTDHNYFQRKNDDFQYYEEYTYGDYYLHNTIDDTDYNDYYQANKKIQKFPPKTSSNYPLYLKKQPQSQKKQGYNILAQDRPGSSTGYPIMEKDSQINIHDDHEKDPTGEASPSTDDPIDRLALVGASPFIVPGGMLLLGLAVAVFYFNFVWYPTPVVTARLIQLVTNRLNPDLLNIDHQRVIAQIYEALRTMEREYAGGLDSSSECRDRLVCQIHREFPALWHVTSSCTELFKRHFLEELDDPNAQYLESYVEAAARGYGGAKCTEEYPFCSLPDIQIRPALRRILGVTDWEVDHVKPRT